ncbi:MAG: DMT family transporter [Chloroflexota bacterium]
MADQSKPQIPPLLGIAFGILVVSTSSIVIRFAQQDAPSQVIAAWRLTLASLVLVPLLMRSERRTLRELTRSQVGLGLASGVFLALHFVTWIASLEHTTVASSVVLVSTIPLFMAALSPLTLHEPITRPVLAGMLLATVGSISIGLSDICHWQAGLHCGGTTSAAGGPLVGDLLALAGALAGAGYFLIGRRLRADLSLLSYIGLSYSTAAVVLLLLVLVSGQPLLAYPPITYLWFAFLALGPQLLGHSSFNWALRFLPAAFVGITLLGEPVGSTILAALLLDERPSVVKALSMMLTLAGIYLASRATTRPSSPGLAEAPGRDAP